MIYFLSDLHIGHKNIIKYEDRPYKSNDQMTEQIIKNWNNLITNEDTVYNLGDFFFSMDKKEMSDILDRLHYKEMILIAGNHDHSKDLKFYKSRGIKVLYADMIKRNGIKYYLSHYPIFLGGTKGIFNVHGHIHSGCMETDYHINVSLDALGDKFALSFDELENQVRYLRNIHPNKWNEFKDNKDFKGFTKDFLYERRN